MGEAGRARNIHMRTRSVVSWHMSEEVGQQMQVAQPATPTTPIPTHHPTTAPSPPTQHIPTHHCTPPPTHHPGWHPCHVRECTHHGHKWGGGGHDALATRRTERRNGQVEGCYVPPVREAIPQVDILGPKAAVGERYPTTCNGCPLGRTWPMAGQWRGQLPSCVN